MGADCARGLVERVAVAGGVMMPVRARRGVAAALRAGTTAAAAAAVLLGCGTLAEAQEPSSCRFLCDPTWKVEPTFTIENLLNRHRVATPDGTITQANRERVFETVLALDLATRVPRLGFSAEAIVAPFKDDNDAELEFETNLYWLTEEMTRGWLSSHFDVVDQFSPAERPNSRRAYSHK